MLKLPDFDEFFFKFRYPILVFLVGALLTGLGLFVSKNDIRTSWRESGSPYGYHRGPR